MRDTGLHAVHRGGQHDPQALVPTLRVEIGDIPARARRCVVEHIWTSNYLLSKHEILPNKKMSDLWQPHPWTKHSAGYVFDDVAVGGWTLGLDMKPSLCVGRKVNGNPEVLIPARYLGGILPDCLTDNFRFWRDETLHTIVAERTLEADGKK